ncbi:hypothetical protein [Archangium sp.]|uniref:hypothetical protein n=1 Tax=Archangium sp. TaxID=1872627 RepID=UPI00286BE60C|nr:hypothetical protein [Archangium sp.]
MKMWLRSARSGLAVLTWAAAAVAGAQQPAADLTGVYTKEGASLAILQGDAETLVYYGAGFPQGQSVGTCECALVLQKKEAPDRWTLKSQDANDAWTLRVEEKRLLLEGRAPKCCAVGWPGAGAFNRSDVKPPQSCKVTAERAYFHAPDAKTTQRKTFVVAGDSVQAHVPAFEPDFVSGRFVAPNKKVTVGQLKLAQLNCAEAEAGAEANNGVDLTGYTGKWVRVQRKGKGYVIQKPCSANNPNFTLKPNGDMTIDSGQEEESFKVTSILPGVNPGTYALEVTRVEDTSSSDDVEWVVVDKKKEIVSLKSDTGFFQKAQLFVREDKQAGIPVKAEACK